MSDPARPTLPLYIRLVGSTEFRERATQDWSRIPTTATGQRLLDYLSTVLRGRKVTIEEFTPPRKVQWAPASTRWHRSAVTVPTAVIEAGMDREALYRALEAGGLCSGSTLAAARCNIALLASLHVRAVVETRPVGKGDFGGAGFSENGWVESKDLVQAGTRGGAAPTVLFDPFEWDDLGQGESVGFLVHELVHCAQYLAGRVNEGRYAGPGWVEQWHNIAEAEATGWQNAFMSELNPGRGPRNYHFRHLG